MVRVVQTTNDRDFYRGLSTLCIHITRRCKFKICEVINVDSLDSVQRHDFAVPKVDLDVAIQAIFHPAFEFVDETFWDHLLLISFSISLAALEPCFFSMAFRL